MLLSIPSTLIFEQIFAPNIDSDQALTPIKIYTQGIY